MKVLLVEDDRDLGSALSRSLFASDFDVVWAERLERAKQFVAEHRFHCVVLDLNLPDGEGFSLLTFMRQKGNMTPLLVMTARSGLEDRLRALNSGADDYVVKPFATEEMIARVHALVRRSSGFATPLWQAGDLLIDTLDQVVQVDGKTIQLTPREYAVLRELALACGRVVSREVLIDRVWGTGEMPSDGAIEYQLHGLRRKIGAQRVRTLRGVGYALVWSSVVSDT